MTLLKIDLKDVVGEVCPSDHVRVWAPAHREGPNGETVNPRPVKIPLVNGVGEQEVFPGPLVIEIVAHDSRQDTRAKQVDIPDQASITLTEALDGAFVYTPAVVSRVAQDAAAAKAAALAAQEAVDTPGRQGDDGLTPYIQGGTWWIGDQDTGVTAEVTAPTVTETAPGSGLYAIGGTP